MKVTIKKIKKLVSKRNKYLMEAEKLDKLIAKLTEYLEYKTKMKKKEIRKEIEIIVDAFPLTKQQKEYLAYDIEDLVERVYNWAKDKGYQKGLKKAGIKILNEAIKTIK